MLATDLGNENGADIVTLVVFEGYCRYHIGIFKI